jgi:hypothetical protein
MTEEEKTAQDLEQKSDSERRDFLAKAVAAAGALAASGMLAEALGSEAEARIATTATPAQTTLRRAEIVKDTPLRYEKMSNGHTLSMGGTELNEILIREGLLSKGLAGKSSVMSLKLEWS